MIKKILLTLAALVAVVFAYVAVQPSAYTVSRSIVIAATPEAVFQHINDFHKWQAWSPWAALDPAAKTTFDGPPQGKGAVFGWNGNDAVGEGRMTITDSTPSSAIAIKLDFVRPFTDTADVAFALEPVDGETMVTWSMAGENNFVGRLFCLFNDMDAMIGRDYDKGLASLKSIVESGA